MPSLLSQLAISGVIATSSASVDIPPVPELSATVSDATVATNSSSMDLSRNIPDMVDDGRTPVGIDISSHQHNNGSHMNVREVAVNGQDFAFIKATEGTHYVNPHFRPDVVDFVDSNTPIGFYHYGRPTSNPEEAREQARFFVDVTGMGIGVKSLPPVLDIEEPQGLSPRQLIDWTHAYVDEIKKLTGRDTMIYTYPYFWKHNMGNTTEFNHLPLWIAHYTTNNQPGSLPGGWTDWTFWQHTSEGTVTGAHGHVDQNRFSGTMSELREMYVRSDLIPLGDELSSMSSSSTSDSAPEVNVISGTETDNIQTQSSVIAGEDQSRLPELKNLLDTFEE